ncbi:MAG: YraN family protein [Opitutaceae bacterium]|nr:YraN family protein [Opitutaceae bacterium]
MNVWTEIRQLFGIEKPLPTGAWGERAAAEWLERERGFRIVARNWRSPGDRRDELDLIAMDGAVLVFLEVKTRSAQARVSGYHAINRRKRTVLKRASDAYLRSLRPSERPPYFRFDVVEVTAGNGSQRTATFSHFQNVPLFRRYYRR